MRNFGRDRDNKPGMHKAVCSNCGKDCEVPFKPTGDKPVFCSDCFSKSRGGDSRRSGRRDSGRGKFGDKTMHKAVCSNCGNDCEVPFRPTGDKPIFCSNCFEKSGGARSKGTDKFAEQFEMLNTKLDQILEALTIAPKKTTAKPKKVAKKKPAKKVAASNKKKKKKTAVKKKK